VAFCVNDVTRCLHCGLNDFGEIDHLHAQLQRAARDARNIQQVFQQQRHVLHLSDNHIAAPALLRLRCRRSFENECGLADRCEWITQFMGEGRKEFILAAIGFAKRNLRALADGDLLPQRVFCSLAPGDVSGDFGGADN